MPRIALDKLQPGMKLAKPVMNQSGLVVLAEGAELTTTLIEKIHDMEFVGVFV